MISRIKRALFGQSHEERNSVEVTPPGYPLPPGKTLRCGRCGERMDWNITGWIFECECRRFGVSAEAIEYDGGAYEDVEVVDVE